MEKAAMDFIDSTALLRLNADQGLTIQYGESVTLVPLPAILGKGFIYQQTHAGNDGDIGNVEYVPGEAESMKQEEVGDGTVKDSVESIAKRAANDEPEARGR
jgi:hypothetical protein